MEFNRIFNHFLERRDYLTTVFVATVGANGQPNCSPKMVIDIVKPNKIFFVDIKTSQTYSNIENHWQCSLSFMDEKTLTGVRLGGFSQLIDSGREFIVLKDKWMRKVTAYEADRMIERIKGIFSGRPSEIALPKDFMVMKFIAEEGAIVKPDNALRAAWGRRRDAESVITDGNCNPAKRPPSVLFEKALVSDDLTGVYNRRGFVTLFDQQLKIAHRSQKESFVIFSDFEHFRPYHESLARTVSEQMIMNTAQILKKTFRDSDILARIGTDEFAGAVIDCGQEGLRVVTQRLRKNIDDFNNQKQSHETLALSFRVTSCKLEESVHIKDLLNRSVRLQKLSGISY